MSRTNLEKIDMVGGTHLVVGAVLDRRDSKVK